MPAAARSGLFSGLHSLCYVLSCLWLRPLTDAVRPRRVLALSLLALGGFALLMHLGGSMRLAFVLYGLSGVSIALFWPVIMGWMSRDLDGPALSRVMSRFNISWSSGAILSPLLGGWLSSRAVALPIFVAAGVALAAAALLAATPRLVPEPRRDGGLRVGSGAVGSAKEKSTRLRYAAWVGVFTTYVALGVLANVFPLSAREDLHLDKSLIGMVLLSRGLFTTLGFALLGQMVFWHHRSGPMLLGQIGLAGCAAALVCVRYPLGIGAILAAIGLLGALCYFNSMFHGLVGSANRTARRAIHEFILGLGAISGSVFGGMIYQRASMATVFRLVAALLLAGVLVQAAIALWARRTDEDAGGGIT